MDPHPLHFISYTTWNFGSLSKDNFRDGRHDLNFSLIKTTCNSHSFSNLTAKFWVGLPLCCRKIVGLSWDLVLFFYALLMLFSIGLYRHILSFLKSSYYFWRPFLWILIFGPASFVLLKSLIEGQPIRSCIKKPVNRPVNHFFMLKWCTAAKIHYYSSVSWFLIPMTGDIVFAAHIYFNVKKSRNFSMLDFTKENCRLLCN